MIQALLAQAAEAHEEELADLDQDYEPEDLEEADAGGVLACLQHQATAAGGTCEGCGAGLCGWCFERFQPPSCPGCVLSRARQRRQELMLHAGWFFGVLLLVPGYAPAASVIPTPATPARP